MKTIFTVTMVSAISHNRIVGWFRSYKSAEYVVLNNVGDIRECDYRLCVIEEIPGGHVYPCPPENEQWFRWHTDKYIKIDKPNMYNRVVNFGIG